MKRLLIASSIICTLLFVGCGQKRDVDSEIKKRLVELNKVGFGGSSDFITTDTIEVINDVDGSLIRAKTRIICDEIEFEVTIFKDDVIILPVSEL